MERIHIVESISDPETLITSIAIALSLYIQAFRSSNGLYHRRDSFGSTLSSGTPRHDAKSCRKYSIYTDCALRNIEYLRSETLGQAKFTSPQANTGALLQRGLKGTKSKRAIDVETVVEFPS